MSKTSTAKTSPERRGDAPLRRADIAAGKLVLRKRAASGAVLPNKQREALKQAIQTEAIEAVVRKTIREELRRT